MDRFTGSNNNNEHIFAIGQPAGSFPQAGELYTEGWIAGGLSEKQLSVVLLEPDTGVFSYVQAANYAVEVTVLNQREQLTLLCNCGADSGRICDFQSLVLHTISSNDEIRLFFDTVLRRKRLMVPAPEYGLEHEPDLDLFFNSAYTANKTVFTPKQLSLLPVTADSISLLADILLPQTASAFPNTDPGPVTRCIVLRRHKFYKNLVVELYEAQTTKEGKLKNPLARIEAQELIWSTTDTAQVKFFTAIAGFENKSDTKTSNADINALASIVQNPLGLPVYYHNSDVSESIVAAALIPIRLELLKSKITYTVTDKPPFFIWTGYLEINGTVRNIKDITTELNYFVVSDGNFYLATGLQLIQAVNFFKRKGGEVMVHHSKFDTLKSLLLDKIETGAGINYTYIQKATPRQLTQQGFNAAPEKIIYLSDSGAHVVLMPVIKYGDVEIPVRSKKQVYGRDEHGKDFLVQRDNDAEIKFVAMLVQQHPDFLEQLDNDLKDFYLHKSLFLDEEWFLSTFESWRDHGIAVLGFNDIKNNKLNPNKAEVSIKVTSGINWFNTEVNVRFGKKKASLKKLAKAVQSKSRYVTLDDGTQGILPTEWVEKFSRYFNAADFTEDDLLCLPKMSFDSLSEIFDDEMLDESVRHDIETYRNKIANFTAADVPLPVGLNATLRPYQMEGLKWLNFLDDLNFGGCLADDMGLGKTIQVIAFILSQRAKVAHNTNLLVVPSSLVFNWKAEIDKFAPSIKVLTLVGSNRVTNTSNFDQFELVITTYGTLLADITFLQKYKFNYVFLDESQNIKNPDSERYKAAIKLSSRNRIVITGTPLENNTFDLYGQLSFACPGLLGNRRYFRDIYATPVDKFDRTWTLNELKAKISPFVLRRKKAQVATELPEKTEMVLCCEMQPDQRAVYDAYEKEFRDFICAITDKELPKNSVNVLKGLTRLRQICNAPALLRQEKFASASAAKVEVLMSEIENKSPVHKILVFSQFVGMLDIIKSELIQRNITYSYLTGATTNRKQVVNEFQENDDIRVFLISLKAGGTGLNLTAADYVYIVDPWWNPAVENQAIDRVYRIGQRKNVVAVRLICSDTIEEKIQQLQESKTMLASDLVGANEGLPVTLSRDSLIGFLQG